MSELKELAAEAKHELLTHIIPFWRGMRDDKFGGYYGYLSYDLALDEKAEKGCILNSRITWFFANAYLLYKDGGISEEECEAAGFKGEDLLAEAKHGYEFLRDNVENRIALTFPVLIFDKFTLAIPTCSDKSFKLIFLSAITLSNLNIIAILHLQHPIYFFL